MDIAALLKPFVPGPLTPEQLARVQVHLDLLLRWNARTNLTAVRDAESIVTRHIGESLFAAATLLDSAAIISMTDVGSGAGFPGIPMKIWAPSIELVLVESQGKKVAFLREVARALRIPGVSVFGDRAERLERQSDLVTMRAVERFDNVLPVAARLVTPGGRLGLLIGEGQVASARRTLGDWVWSEPALVPQSRGRVIVSARKPHS